MRLNIFNSLIGLCVATAVVSCSDALVDNLDNRPVGGEASDMISFVVADQNNTTRGGSFGNRPYGGAYLRTANGADSLYLNMSVADITDDFSTRAEVISDSNLPSRLYMTCRLRKDGTNYSYYFDDVEFTKNGDVWSSNPPYYWLNSGEHFTFYGYYAPADANGVTFNGNSNMDCVPTIDYTVPSNVSDQFDLVYHLNNSESEFISTGRNQTVPLNIKHALSKICFKTGTIASTITGVTIRNVCKNGTLNLGTGAWKLNTELKGDFSISGLDVSTNETEFFVDDNSFMLLPGSILENSELAVYIEGETEPYTASLKDCKWEAGKQYTYTINITPETPKSELEIIIEPEYKTVDAHYVIAKAKVKVPEGQPNKSWKLVVSASDEDADVTIVQKGTSDYESLYEEDYWLDKVAVNGVPTDISARGTNEIEGIGTQDFYIFIPENINEDGITRKIYIEEIMEDNTSEKLNIKVKDSDDEPIKYISQYAPAWTDGFGWEQIDDNPPAPWGFCSSEKQIYLYKSEKNNGNSEHKTVEDLLGKISSDLTNAWKKAKDSNNNFYYYIIFESDNQSLRDNDNRPVAQDPYNGLANTNGLNDIINESDKIKQYEEAVRQTKKGDGTNAFESVPEVKDDKGNIITSQGTQLKDQMLTYILKKNKFNVQKFENQGAVTFVPTISEIQWYLPAYKQFENIPSSVKDKIDTTDCWSSTAVSDNQNAYTGSGTPTSREIPKNIWVCRNSN